MKYELKNERDKNLSLLLQVLKNRGIQEIDSSVLTFPFLGQ